MFMPRSLKRRFNYLVLFYCRRKSRSFLIFVHRELEEIGNHVGSLPLYRFICHEVSSCCEHVISLFIFVILNYLEAKIACKT
jgi:hypothetical protein